LSTHRPEDDYRGLTAIWALTAQAIMALLGYLAACLAAAIFAVFAILNIGVEELQQARETLWQSLVLIFTTYAAVVIAAFPPFLIVLVITEAFRLRGFVAHLVAGVLVGAVYGLPVAAIFSDAEMPDISAQAVQLSIASGAIGGIVYWAIAGRTAGRWTELPWFERNRR
jgi:hypothetical protein